MIKKRSEGVRRIVLAAMLAAVLIAAKEILAFLPNIEVVSLLIILFALAFPRESLLAVAVFVAAEGLLWGFGTWWISYVYVWPLLYLLTRLLSRAGSPLVFIALSTLFGLCFGALCSIVYIFIGGPGMAWAWFLAGVPFDLLHGAGNLVAAAAMFVPLRRALLKIRASVRPEQN